MIEIPQHIKESLRESMRSPEGTFSIKILFDKYLNEISEPSEIIIEQISGGHYFRLERTIDLKIKLYHSSPGTGTRLVQVNLSKSTPSRNMMFTFTWTPAELRLYVKSLDVPDSKLEESVAITTDINFKVTKDGRVVEVGNTGMLISSIRLKYGNETVLDSSAIESWNETLEAIDLLMNASSPDGYMFEVIKSNTIVVSLVTGIETYYKRRLQELESEGVNLSYSILEEKCGLTKEKIFAPTSNYFQSLKHVKIIWRYLVSINISEIDQVAWKSFTNELYPHRHIVIHAHALRSEMPHSNKSELYFVTKEVTRLKTECVSFIQKLHKRTLELR